MKVAILADIHSNLTALEAVLGDVEARGGTDEVWCLGDIVGYGPDPQECLDLLRRNCSACVAGNHDWAAIGKMDTSLFNPLAAEAAHWTSRQLRPDDIRFLEGLPLNLEKNDFTLVHGSPRDPIWEYLLSAAEAEENLKYFQTKYCLIGHSHHPLLFECNKYCNLDELKDETLIRLGEKRLIINPGGVGQPRDGDPRASYAIFDQESGAVSIHRVEYDFSVTQQKMRKAGLPQPLIERLAYGL